MTQRDDKGLIGTINGEFKGVNEMGYKPPVKGNIDFKKQTSRKPLILEDFGREPG